MRLPTLLLALALLAPAAGAANEHERPVARDVTGGECRVVRDRDGRTWVDVAAVRYWVCYELSNWTMDSPEYHWRPVTWAEFRDADVPLASAWRLPGDCEAEE